MSPLVKGDSFVKQFLDWFATGGLVALFGLLWKSNYDREQSIGRVYKRFDEYKKHIEETHVSKDVCTVIHEDSKRQFCEIKNSLDKLHEKIDRK